MGSSHAATGALAGAVAGALAGGGVVVSAVAAVVGAGAALLPDVDHPGSTASLSQGPVSGWVCAGVRAASSAVWAATRARGDDGGWRDGAGRHRHVTHTPVVCAVVGVAAGLVAGLHPLVAGVVVWVVAGLGVRGLARCVPGGLPPGAAGWVAVSAMSGVVAAAWVWAGLGPLLLGVLVGAGMLVHVAGDWLTPSGVPLAWPARWRGRRWWMFRSPVAFAAGDCWQERAVRWVCGLGVVLVLVV